MSIQEELQLLRVEIRTLRQEVARYKHAWEQQKARADRLEPRKPRGARQDKIAGETERRTQSETRIHTNVKKEENDHGRARGGQIGHTGHGRGTPERIDEEKDVCLTACPDCGHAHRAIDHRLRAHC